MAGNPVSDPGKRGLRLPNINGRLSIQLDPPGVPPSAAVPRFPRG